MVLKTKNKLKLLVIGIVVNTLVLFAINNLITDVFSAYGITLYEFGVIIVASIISFSIVFIYDKNTNRVLFKEQLPSSN